MNLGTQKIVVSEWKRQSCTGEEVGYYEDWAEVHTLTSDNKKVIAATLRGMADAIDPPTNERY